MPEELFDILDENGNLTGEQRSRLEAHTQGLWHRTVHIYLFRSMGKGIEILVHLRAKTKDLNPNRWDTRFGGHIKAGENISEALKSELKEEVGLELEETSLIRGESTKEISFLIGSLPASITTIFKIQPILLNSMMAKFKQLNG